LRLLHPFMPFITEELWHQLPRRADEKSIALQPFDVERLQSGEVSRANEFSLIQDVIAELRNIRAEMKLDPKKKVGAEFHSSYGYIRDTMARNAEGIARLAILTKLDVSATKLAEAGGAVRSTAKFDVRMAYATDVVDVAAERARLRKEIESLEKTIGSKETQLGNPTFRGRAPEKIILGMEATMAEQKLELDKLNARLRDLTRS
jgi:valyl-tRNA synthetase